MATTSYGTPMTMGMTAGMGSQPMTTTGLQAGVVRNMNLPLSRATPIQVTETTPNLEEIQNFPVAGRGLDGTHFNQDPVSGQMYVMTDEFHQRIPEILLNNVVKKQNELIEQINSTVKKVENIPLMKVSTSIDLTSNQNISVVRDKIITTSSKTSVVDLTRLKKVIFDGIYSTAVLSNTVSTPNLSQNTAMNVDNRFDLGLNQNQSGYFDNDFVTNTLNERTTFTEVIPQPLNQSKLINGLSNKGSVQGDIYTPINVINSGNNIAQKSSGMYNRFIPINFFINKSSNSQSYNISRFQYSTPINSFYNTSR
jgi:hypothetical protein